MKSILTMHAEFEKNKKKILHIFEKCFFDKDYIVKLVKKSKQ